MRGYNCYEKSKFTEQQIVFALKRAETSIPVAEVCRKIGISEATFFNWKRKFSGLGIQELRLLRQLEDENSKLKQVVADLMLGRADAAGRVEKKVLRARSDGSW